MNSSFLQEDANFAMENCKLLYQDVDKPCTDTCACWGFEMGPGWFPIIKRLSVQLEALNIMFYPKYGVHVVMEQAKEKYGTLHYYYSVRTDSPLLYRMWHLPFEYAYRWMKKNIDYKCKTVVDKQAYESEEKLEIQSDKIDEEKARYANCSNVTFREEGGKTYKISKVFHPASIHIEATKHKILRFVQDILYKTSIITSFYKETTREQIVIAEAVDSIAAKLISQAEKDCYNVCEDCGTSIGTEYSPRVTTKGWINYICEKCDAKRSLVHILKDIKYKMKEATKITLTKDEEVTIESAYELLETEKYIGTKEMVEAVNKVQEIFNKLG